MPSNNKSAWVIGIAITIFMAFITLATGFNRFEIRDQNKAIHEMPNEYVRLERYKCDLEDLKKDIDKIHTKLDLVIEKLP